jgi:TonB family protein
MKTIYLLLALAAANGAAPAFAARVQEPQQVMALDLGACRQPTYPAAALALRAEGKTTVEVQVGAAGQVLDARVAVTSGNTDLDAAALAGIRGCVFHAVAATGQAPTGWLKTQYVWVASAVKQAAPDPALFESTKALAEGGDPAAQNRLGTFYERGTFVKADLAQAAAWYLLAAQSGNAWAQNNLGVLYFRGAGVPKDPQQAVQWYALAAAQGHGWAQANLAWAYQHGATGAVDMDKAVYWLTKSAEGGLAAAQVGLGMLAMQRATVDEERVAAAGWLARAAASGAAPGQYYLGRTFELGLGNVQDDAQAAAWYRKALTRSEGRAETALGMLVEAGRAGSADQDDAGKLYQTATRWRYPAAFYHYGLVLEQRGDGDLAMAVFRQGAELGDCDATQKYVQLAQRGTPAAADMTLRARQCAARPVQAPQL